MPTKITLIYCEEPNMLFRPKTSHTRELYDTAEAIKMTELIDMKKEEPEDYNFFYNQVQQKKAVITSQDAVAIFHNATGRVTPDTLYLVSREMFKKFIEVTEGRSTKNKDVWTYEYTVDNPNAKYYETTRLWDEGSVLSILKKSNAVSLEMAATIMRPIEQESMDEAIARIGHEKNTRRSQTPESELRQERTTSSATATATGTARDIASGNTNVIQQARDAVHKNTGLFGDDFDDMPVDLIPIGNDVIKGTLVDNALYMCAKGSRVAIIAKALKKPCITVPAATGNVNVDIDKRYPYRYVPCEVDGNIGYAAVIKNTEYKALEPKNGGIPIAAEGDLLYHFYEINGGDYTYYADLLPSVLKGISFLDNDISIGNKISNKVVKTLFSDKEDNLSEEEREKEEKVLETMKKYYGAAFKRCRYFKVTAISNKTGLMTAFTRNGTQVLMMAAVNNKGSGAIRDGLFSFIPVKDKFGVAFVGLDFYTDAAYNLVNEIDEIYSLWNY